MIYVQIASYRDPQLKPTIENMLDMAKDPDNVRIAIVDQSDNGDAIIPKTNRGHLVFSIPYQRSLGCCWARGILNDFYSGEKYTLQLDSHHRFIQDWDAILIDMLESLPENSYLTTYAPSFDPVTESKINNAWIMKVEDKCIRDGTLIPLFRPDYNEAAEPTPTILFSGHFFFAPGRVIEQVPYDKELYFHGEEATMAARLYTHGWDGYHPHIPIIWHEYTRAGRPKVWDDDKEWWKKDQAAQARAKLVLAGRIPGQLGDKKTIKSFYEKLYQCK